MLSKIKPALVVGAVAVLALAGSLVGSGSARASDFLVGNGGTFSSAWNPTPSRFVLNGTAVNCTSAGFDLSVTSGAHTFGMPIGTVEPFGNFCTGPLALAANVSCLGRNIAVSGFTSGGAAVEQTLMCSISIPVIGCTVFVTGDVQAEYVNPTSMYLNDGRLVVLAAAQNLAISSSPCSGVLPNGAVAYGAPAGSTGINDLDLALDTFPSPHPVIF